MTDRLTTAEALIRTACERKPTDRSLLVALDGRCASGKTTLAAALSEALADIGCTVLHMDDFFLRPAQRTSLRLATPGENVDHERFRSEVLSPLSEGKPFVYIPFSCKEQRLLSPREVTPMPIVLVEGSYACHPCLRELYDLCLFLSVDAKTQMSRILERNGMAAAETFRTRWIPLEEAYIEAHRPQDVSVYLA